MKEDFKNLFPLAQVSLPRLDFKALKNQAVEVLALQDQRNFVNRIVDILFFKNPIDRNVAEKVDDTSKKQLLIDLAEMEDEHEETFKSLRKELTIDEKMQTTFDPDGESERYLRALADTRVFYEKNVFIFIMRDYMSIMNYLIEDIDWRFKLS